MKLAVAAAWLAIALAPIATPALAGDAPVAMPGVDDCPDCQAPRRYDSEEVIRSMREVDRSRVINTTTVVPVYRHAPGSRPATVYVRPAVTVVNFVTRHYHVTEGPVDFAVVPVYRRAKTCHDGRTGSCRRMLRVRG